MLAGLALGRVLRSLILGVAPTDGVTLIRMAMITSNHMDDDIVRADPRFRRQALLLLAAAAALFAAGIRWGLPWLDAARQTQPGVQRITCLSFGGVIVGLSLLVVYSGRRIARGGGAAVGLQQFPPPGMNVLRDGRRVTGAHAVLLGRGYLVIGWLLVVLALVLVVLGAYIVAALWPR